MALTQVLRGTGELSASFSYSATLNQAPFAQGEARADTLLTPVTSQTPISALKADAPNALLLQRSAGAGRLYYSAHLSVYRPVEEITPLNQGIAISRVFTNVKDNQLITSIKAGERANVHITLTVPETAYYLVVEDYFPSGSEVLDINLKTSQLGTNDCRINEGPSSNCYNPRSPYANGWGWWFFSAPQSYDDHISWTAEMLPPGTYELTYTLVNLLPGEYRVLPARAWQYYFPEVQGISAGELFAISK
jgi:uncharacterized protein YfaS (alpha-2-macroglobulin family)